MEITNEMVAVKVMRWEKLESTPLGVQSGYPFFWKDSDGNYKHLPNFLNDHNSAMMVVEKMREDGFVYEVDEAPCSRDYHVMFYGIDEHLIGDCEATSESLCHAICEAALKAKEVTP